jgi:L-ascorbate metabolism protein UlaG (beta-lactamase superfamily)
MACGAAIATACAAVALAVPEGRQPMDGSGRFTNLDGSTPPGFGAVLRWGVWDRLTRKRRRSPARAPVPCVLPDLARIATPPRPGEGARLTWLGHAGFLVQLDGVSLLVDPVLSPSLPGGVGRNAPPGVPVELLPRIDAQLVTHSHYDHMDLPTLRRVGARVVAGLGTARLLGGAVLACEELAWWAQTRVGRVTVTFVPAQHWSRRGLADANRALWGGFVIEGSSARLYHAGDSALFDGFAAIGRRFPNLDAALLPIGAYDPGWFMERQHLSPEQAVRAFVDLGARTFVATHWGTFKLSDEPLDEPPLRLRAGGGRRGLAEGARRVPAVGETIEVRAAALTP